MRVHSICIDSDDPQALAGFYARMLGWQVMRSTEDYTQVGVPGERFCLFFQASEGYVPPVWPEEPGMQQQMVHVDFAAEDVEQAVRHAVACGARVADAQFASSAVVMIDPAGHPFCICPEG